MLRQEKYFNTGSFHREVRTNYAAEKNPLEKEGDLVSPGGVFSPRFPQAQY